MRRLIFDYGLNVVEVEGMTIGRLLKYLTLAAEHAEEQRRQSGK